jgi:uncharacterized protein YydD (DUF2326 family)
MKEQLDNIISFLSEDEKKRFEKGVVDLLLDRVDRDLEEYNYHLADYCEIEEKINEAVDEVIKATVKRVEERYKKQLEGRIKSLIIKGIC